MDTSLPIHCGVRAEIVVRVNAASFRAVGEVRAIRGQSGAGLEFVHLSAGGKNMLGDLLKDLARLQVVMNKLKSARRERDAASFRKQLEEGKYQLEVLSQQFPFLRNILAAESEESPELEAAAGKHKDQMAKAQSLVITVDLFG